MVEQERFYLSTSESERRMRREGKRASMKTTLNPTHNMTKRKNCDKRI